MHTGTASDSNSARESTCRARPLDNYRKRGPSEEEEKPLAAAAAAAVDQHMVPVGTQREASLFSNSCL